MTDDSKIILIERLRKGDILFYKDYPELETGHRDKYIVLLSNNIKEKFFYGVLTTSQLKYYESNPFNRIDTKILIPDGKLFKKKTVLDFKKIREFTVKNLKTAYKNKLLKYYGKFNENLIEEINNAIKNSSTIESNKIDLICNDSNSIK